MRNFLFPISTHIDLENFLTKHRQFTRMDKKRDQTQTTLL